MLYALAASAAKTLDISVPQVVEAAGYWFIPYVLTTEYGRMLSMAGKTFSECLKNLNAMHGHLRIAHFHSMNMPNIRATMEVRSLPLESQIIFILTVYLQRETESAGSNTLRARRRVRDSALYSLALCMPWRRSSMVSPKFQSLP